MEIIALDGLKEILAQPQKIFITTHTKPDGDAIGSSLALYHYLGQCGHNVKVVVPTAVPDFLEWLPGTGEIISFDRNKKQGIQVLEQADLMFCLDFNKYERTQDILPYLSSARQPKVLIDHHLFPDLEKFNYLYSAPEKSSTAEMVYDFIQMMGDGEKINLPVMQAIYTGMLTDTGSFRFPATGASVHQIIADFKMRGFEHAVIHELIFDTWSENRMRLMGYLFYEKLSVDQENGFGYIHITKEELERFAAGPNDTEGLVNMITSIRLIKVAVLITERNDALKLSFRSKGSIDVNLFAKSHFNGGGHFNASGGTSYLSWPETEKILLDKLPEFIHSSLNLS